MEIEDFKFVIKINDWEGWELQPSQCHLKYSKTKTPTFIFSSCGLVNFNDPDVGYEINVYNAIENDVFLSTEGIEIIYEK